MLHKIKHSSSGKKASYNKHRTKLSTGHKRLLFGTTDVVKNGLDFLEKQVVKNILKMFYVYLKLKLKDASGNNIQIVYSFMGKFILRKHSHIDSFSISEAEALKKVFEKCYESFIQSMSNDDMLTLKVRGANSRELDYLSIGEQQAVIVQLVSDYIDFLVLRYGSKTLSLDHPLGIAIAKSYIAKSNKNLDKKTNIDTLKRAVTQRVLEVKISFVNQTIEIVRADLNAYLSDEKCSYVKTRVMQEYDTYYRDLDHLLHLKNNLTTKVRTHEEFFTHMNDLGMNWVCDCADVKSARSDSFYVYIYDLIMYKYRLLTYLYMNEWKMKSQQEILASLDDKASYPNDEKTFDFFTRHIQSEKDINAHIIKLFEKKHQKFIKTLLAIKTRTTYIKEEVTPVFYPLVDITFKHRPITAATRFPISVTFKELYPYFKTKNHA